MEKDFETYQKYFHSCTGDFGKGCYECCAMRENGCCELSRAKMAELALNKLGIYLDDYSIETLPEKLFGLAEKKKRTFDIDAMLDAIRETLQQEKIQNCIVKKDDGLLSRYCQRNGIETNVRGLRNSKDYTYEEELVTVNNLYNKKLDTVYFRGGGNQISSSTVRELMKYKEDVSMFVPEPVFRLISKGEN